MMRHSSQEDYSATEVAPAGGLCHRRRTPFNKAIVVAPDWGAITRVSRAAMHTPDRNDYPILAATVFQDRVPQVRVNINEIRLSAAGTFRGMVVSVRLDRGRHNAPTFTNELKVTHTFAG